MVHFGYFWRTWSLLSNSVTRQVNFDSTKIGGKCQNETFWVIFKQCEGHFYYRAVIVTTAFFSYLSLSVPSWKSIGFVLVKEGKRVRQYSVPYSSPWWWWWLVCCSVCSRRASEREQSKATCRERRTSKAFLLFPPWKSWW